MPSRLSQPLPVSEANGKILFYNVSCSSEEKTQSLSEIPDPQHKAEMQLDKNDYIISVVAKNSAGSSPPSKIASMEIPNGEWLGRRRAAGEGGAALSPWPLMLSAPTATGGQVGLCQLRAETAPSVPAGSLCPGGRGSRCSRSLCRAVLGAVVVDSVTLGKKWLDRFRVCVPPRPHASRPRGRAQPVWQEEKLGLHGGFVERTFFP